MLVILNDFHGFESNLADHHSLVSSEKENSIRRRGNHCNSKQAQSYVSIELSQSYPLNPSNESKQENTLLWKCRTITPWLKCGVHTDNKWLDLANTTATIIVIVISIVT